MTLREETLKMHKDNNGKLAVCSKVPMNNRYDLSLAYTPGVAEPCKDIKEDKNLSFDYTCRGNMIAVVTDGTRVLGLGDIGPEAAMPVMEGKAVLFKTFGDVDAVPICLDTKDPDEFIRTVRLLQPNYSGINLEDISSPKCYDIEDKLKEIMDIPVFHDDQHGTAIAVLAGVMGGLRLVKKDIKTAKIVVNGCGAAGTAIGKLFVNMGAENVTMVDMFGTLYEGIDVQLNRVQQELAKTTNKSKFKGNLADAAKGADVLVHESTFSADEKEMANQYNHSTSIDAAKTAKEAGVEKLLLTHISARYLGYDTKQLEKEARSVFAETYVMKDFQIPVCSFQ